MNRQMKDILWIGIIILLSTACGSLNSTPTPEEMPEPNVTSEPKDPEKFSKYMGLRFPPLPAGLSEGFSMIIQDSDDYALSLVSDADGKMLWFSKLTQHDSNGNAVWEVRDILDLSNFERDVILIPDGCQRNGEVDSEIFVVSKNGKTLMAWRANTASNLFEVIPTNGIECHSDKGVSLE